MRGYLNIRNFTEYERAWLQHKLLKNETKEIGKNYKRRYQYNLFSLFESFRIDNNIILHCICKW